MQELEKEESPQEIHGSVKVKRFVCKLIMILIRTLAEKKIEELSI